MSGTEFDSLELTIIRPGGKDNKVQLRIYQENLFGGFRSRPYSPFKYQPISAQL